MPHNATIKKPSLHLELIQLKGFSLGCISHEYELQCLKLLIYPQHKTETISDFTGYRWNYMYFLYNTHQVQINL